MFYLITYRQTLSAHLRNLIMTQEVTAYIEALTLAWQAVICTQLRQIIHQAIPDVAERLQYKKPHYLKNGHYAAVIGTAKGWVTLTIFNATDLVAPDGFFEAGGDDKKTLKIREGQPLDGDLLSHFLQQAASTL